MTIQDCQDRTETGQTSSSVRSFDSKTKPKAKTIKSLPKDHAGFWEGRLKKRGYTDRQGNAVLVPEWQVRLFHGGREAWLNLGSANRAAAAVKARDAYVCLKREGWAAMLARFKPDSEVAKGACTVGAYLDAVKGTSLLRETTLATYSRKFMTLLAGSFGVKDSPSKFDYVNGGREEWLKRLHRVQLDKITDAKVEKWRLRYLKAAEQKNPLAYKHAKVTLNSIIRGSKALFTPAVVKNIKLTLPSPLPLAGVANVPIERQRYRSTIDPQALLVAAREELAYIDPEVYKALLLALCAGLRRDEIDNLAWKQINWKRHVIVVETSVHTAAKSASSENEVDCDPALLEALKSYMKPGCGEFVIQSANKPKPQRTASYTYRADKVFDKLIGWLHGKGVQSRNPIHALRKEFGSVIASKAGIFAASLALRHADIGLTRSYYLDKKAAVSFPMGEMLKEAK